MPEYLESNEVVLCVHFRRFGSNTWLVALTSDRFPFLEAAMLTSSVDTQGIHHERAQAVSTSQGWIIGKMMVDLERRVLTIANCQKAPVKVIAELANLHAIGGLSDEEFTTAKARI